MPPQVLSPQSGWSTQLHAVVKGQTQGFMRMQSDAGGEQQRRCGLAWSRIWRDVGGRHSPAKLPVGIQPNKVLKRLCVCLCVFWDDQVVKSKCSEANRYTTC